MNENTPAAKQTVTKERRHSKPIIRGVGATVALLVPCAAVLDVPLFDRINPHVLGVPFIDAYLLFWVLALTPCLLVASHFLDEPDGP